MRNTQQFSVTLPVEMANLVKTKVAGGENASESEVIRDGLRALMARDRAVSAAEVRERLAAQHKQETQAV
jgi:putative addiction module CopG family antidote